MMIVVIFLKKNCLPGLQDATLAFLSPKRPDLEGFGIPESRVLSLGNVSYHSNGIT